MRRTERGLLVTVLAVGLTGAALVAVTGGAGLTATDAAALTLPRLLVIWGQVALAAGLCHGLLRRRPAADQLLFPASLGLTALGLVIIFSLDPGQAQKQMTWLWVSLGALALVLLGPDPRALLEYKYLFGVATVLLLAIPMAVGQEINGARLWVRLGPLSLQFGELAKITLVLFLAGYLGAEGRSLAADPIRLGPLRLPDPGLLLPLLLMWSLGLALLVLLRDLGTALLFYGTCVALLYLATAQAGYLVGGGLAFAGGAWACAQVFGHVQRRLQVWWDPWSVAEGAGYQIVQGLFAIAAGGVGGVGLGLGQAARIPAATTDFPFAAVCEELGLWGAAALVGLYLVWVQRAFRLALGRRDRALSLLAAGLGVLVGLQALVILLGVTKLIPLTGITLPFFSYGGSSLVTNYLLLGLLLRCGEESR